MQRAKEAQEGKNSSDGRKDGTKGERKQETDHRIEEKQTGEERKVEQRDGETKRECNTKENKTEKVHC